MKLIVCMVLVATLGSSSVGLVGAAAEDPVAEVSLHFNPATVALPDVAGDAALNSVLSVTNRQDLAVVLISARAPEGASFATIQEPAVGWVTKTTRSTVEFVGVLNSEVTADLPLRIIDNLAARSGEFEIFIHTIEADLSMEITTPLTPLEQDHGAYTCQLVFQTFVDDAMSFVPVSTVGTTVSSTGALLAAVYDLDYHTYIDPSRVDGTVRVESLGFGRASMEVPLDGLRDAPFVNTAVGPTLTLPGTATQVRAASLWGVSGAERLWFAQNPGPVVLSADVTMDGDEVCTGEVYNFGASISPDVEALFPSPLTLVPPELDSDADGYPNAAELRANSNPLWTTSTPYTDDDNDGLDNGRDPLTIPTVALL